MHFTPSTIGPRYWIRAASLMLAAMVLSGCGLNDLRDRHHDTPQLRALQKSSLSKFGDRPVDGKSVDEFFRNKVALIAVEGGPVPVGRAAPISTDGYYLTAGHVVEQGAIQLSNSAVTSSRRLRVDKYPGRVVWHDRATDLAIVKFDFRPSSLFVPRSQPLGKGDAVFCGASGSNSGQLFTPRNTSGTYDFNTALQNAVGNGTFQTAGRVTSHHVLGDPPRTIHQSTLVGRGGMSGAPVVDGSGQLAGILTGGRVRLFSRPVASFSMLDPATLEAILHADRNRH